MTEQERASFDLRAALLRVQSLSAQYNPDPVEVRKANGALLRAKAVMAQFNPRRKK